MQIRGDAQSAFVDLTTIKSTSRGRRVLNLFMGLYVSDTQQTII